MVVQCIVYSVHCSLDLESETGRWVYSVQCTCSLDLESETGRWVYSVHVI